MRIAIMTDTNSGMTADEAGRLGVALLPMPFTIDGEAFLEGRNLTAAQFYEALKNGAKVATSQPSPADTLAMWDELLQTNDAVVYLPMSSGLSGTCATARMLATEEPYAGRVEVVDNGRISATLRQAVLDALALRQLGLDARTIRDALERTGPQSQIYLAVDTLKYLRQGGRITPAAALLGSALNLKPILQLANGKLDAYKKVRGSAAAQAALLEALRQAIDTLPGDGPLRLMTAYSGDEELGKAWNRKVQQAFPGAKVYGAPLPLSIACHTGPGALGVACARAAVEEA